MLKFPHCGKFTLKCGKVVKNAITLKNFPSNQNETFAKNVHVSSLNNFLMNILNWNEFVSAPFNTLLLYYFSRSSKVLDCPISLESWTGKILRQQRLQCAETNTVETFEDGPHVGQGRQTDALATHGKNWIDEGFEK